LSLSISRSSQGVDRITGNALVGSASPPKQGTKPKIDAHDAASIDDEEEEERLVVALA
jgi:hypothetical protein